MAANEVVIPVVTISIWRMGVPGEKLKSPYDKNGQYRLVVDSDCSISIELAGGTKKQMVKLGRVVKKHLRDNHLAIIRDLIRALAHRLGPVVESPP